VSWTEQDERTARDFFLGRLPEGDREALEERYFSDPAFFESMEAAEAALVHDYLTDSLGAEDRLAFDRFFQTSEPRRREVDFMRAAIHSARPSGKMGGKAAWWAALAACLALAVALSISWRENRRLRADLDRASKSAPMMVAGVVDFTPPAENQRTPGAPTGVLRLGTGDVLVRFHLPVAVAASASCRAVLESPEGTRPATVPAKEVGSGVLIAEFPASTLVAGDHLVMLECGTGSEHAFSFRVNKVQ